MDRRHFFAASAAGIAAALSELPAMATVQAPELARPAEEELWYQFGTIRAIQRIAASGFDYDVEYLVLFLTVRNRAQEVLWSGRSENCPAHLGHVGMVLAASVQ